MSSGLKRKIEKKLLEETPIKKKINAQESKINLQDYEKPIESPNLSTTISSPIDRQISIENIMNQEESKLHYSNQKNKRSSNDDIHQAYINDPKSFIDTYKIVKYRGNIYHLSDTLLIKNEEDANNDFICKLLKIIRPIKPENLKILAFLEVQWFYKKSDLPKKYSIYDKCISKYEIFLSSHKDFIMVDCINGLCNVLTLEEYDKLEAINPNTFYTRAEYDVIKKKFNPPIEDWPKHCSCMTPINPDFMYIQCDKCDSWYHTECVNLPDDIAKTIEKWLCIHCQSKQKIY